MLRTIPASRRSPSPANQEAPVASHLALVMSALCASVALNGDMQREVVHERHQNLVLPVVAPHEHCIGRCGLPK
jgi:hypothetical protein